MVKGCAHPMRIYREQLQASKRRLAWQTAVLDRIHLQRTELPAAGPHTAYREEALPGVEAALSARY